ncbi:endophilin-A1-like [Patiria miniata]|uniref:SH3 domain-containing protein n=1 Tax=Patiria miniata TaxID=46514 RepID=A0A914AKL5_PATMI|nr:endophilin-A1-like [Patiria miniata]
MASDNRVAVLPEKNPQAAAGRIFVHRKHEHCTPIAQYKFELTISEIVSGGSTIPEEEIQFAEEKFHESQELAENGMRNLLESDVEQVLQLQALAEAQLEYHKQSAEVLESLLSTLNERVEEAGSRPKSERKPRSTFNSYSTKRDSSDGDDTDAYPSTVDYNAPVPVTATKERCKALYDFEAENEGELGFQEGDIISIVSKIDENWIDGELNGHTGYFPANYVEII